MNELARTNVKSLVESPAYSNRIKNLLGDRAPQFCCSLVQISQSYGLAKCDPNSIIAAAMIAASLDLPINPNLGFAWIIPYGDKAQFQMGVKGLVQLANRSGQYRRLNVSEVYQGELLNYDRVKGDVVLDADKRKGDTVIGYVAYFELTNGHEHAEYWPKEAVEKHAARFSQSFKSKRKDSPWTTDFDAMAKKTVLKSLLSHWGPLSVQMQDAVVNDGGVKVTVDANAEYPDTDQEPKKQIVEGEKETVDVPTVTPQDELGKVVTEAGFTFDHFQRFGVESGSLPEAASMASFADVPAKTATRLLRATTGLLKGLATAKAQEGGE